MERSNAVIPYLPNQVRRPIPEPGGGGADLHSQLEDLLNAVWSSEENWRFDDRLDMALKLRRQEAA